MDVGRIEKLSSNEEKTLKEQIDNNICKIISNQKEKGYGFLCKIPKLEIKLLITNSKIIGKEDIKNNLKNIELKQNKNPSLFLDNTNNYIINEDFDISIIEIKNNNSNLNDYNYIEIDENILNNNYNYINEYIFILNYSFFNAKYIIEKIKTNEEKNGINNYNFYNKNKTNTFLLILCQSNYKIMGIHNDGVYLKTILKDIYEKKSEIENNEDNKIYILEKSVQNKANFQNKRRPSKTTYKVQINKNIEINRSNTCKNMNNPMNNQSLSVNSNNSSNISLPIPIQNKNHLMRNVNNNNNNYMNKYNYNCNNNMNENNNNNYNYNNCNNINNINNNINECNNNNYNYNNCNNIQNNMNECNNNNYNYNYNNFNIINNNFNNLNNNSVNDNFNDKTNIILKENRIIDNNKENFLINIKFLNINDNHKYINYPKNDLSGLLFLCLMKFISNLFDNNNIYNIKDQELNNIIHKLQDSFNFSNNNHDNIKLVLEKNTGNNILVYSEYINAIINNQKINYLLNFMDYNNQSKIDIYWRCLSHYEEYNSFFEKEFRKDLKKTLFDYSLISLVILENENENEYRQKRNECPNMIKRILYHGTQINPIAAILTDKFKYAKRAFYGMGVYFSDMIDYITFYCGGTDYNNRRDNFGKIIPINQCFSMIASEIFYDETKLKIIKDLSLAVHDFPDFPEYTFLLQNHPEKMIEPNGIHYVKVDIQGDAIDYNTKVQNLRKGELFVNEYAITELYQIFPIYSLTLIRNEYFVLWRDPNFEGQNEFSDYLFQRKLFCNDKAKMNIYCESSTEEALKFLWRRRYNKVILITSVSKDLSGVKFIKVARKIFGFDVMVLFYSNNKEHLKWITNFNNCLYTNESMIYEYYITNFNEIGLKNLKGIIEQRYNITLKEFTNDFLSYPNFINDKSIKEIKNNNSNPYVKEIYIFCEKKNMYIIMTKDGHLLQSAQPELWDVIMIDKEISFYSNGFYLGVKDDNENVIGYKYMKKWYFKNLMGDYYYFAFKEKKNKNILSMEGTWIKVNKEKVSKYELFKLIEKKIE